MRERECVCEGSPTKYGASPAFLSDERTKFAMMKEMDNVTIDQMSANCLETVGSLV